MFRAIPLFLCLMLSAAAFSCGKAPKETVAEIQPNDFRPAFTKKTVIKLNAIVSRQLDVADEYDVIVRHFRSEPDLLDTSSTPMTQEKSLAKLASLSKRSKQNLSDMIEAQKVLVESGEDYNKATFAGMMTFVRNIEREITAQKNAMSLTKKDS